MGQLYQIMANECAILLVFLILYYIFHFVSSIIYTPKYSACEYASHVHTNLKVSWFINHSNSVNRLA
jgi:hypothetical protein